MKSVSTAHWTRQLRPSNCNFCARQLRRQRRLYATFTSNPEVYDLVCVGGGPAGLSILAALRSSPITAHLKIALIESQSLTSIRTFPGKDDYTKFSNRCSSLTPSSVKFLGRIGAWNHVEQRRVQAYEGMQVWDGVSGARIEFEWGKQKGEGKTIAYMNENVNLVHGLMKRIEELGGVEILEGEKVEKIVLGEDEGEEGRNLSGWPVLEVGQRKIAARLLVGADGANSPVRGFAGIESYGWDYGRMGMVATLKMERSEVERIAYQRFLPTGPVACLPLPGNYSTLVWSTTPELAAHLKKLSAKDFIAMVNAAFRLSPADLKYMHTLEEGLTEELEWRKQHTAFDTERTPAQVIGVQEGSIASFPLKMRHADTYIGSRIALVGDAAHTIHPLAGQGLNQGQGDVESLVKTIEYAVEHGQDIGVRMSLEPYEADRYAANNLLLGVVDKLHKLYTVSSGPVVGLRSLGLNAVNEMAPLKEFLMGQAAGTGIKAL